MIKSYDMQGVSSINEIDGTTEIASKTKVTQNTTEAYATTII